MAKGVLCGELLLQVQRDDTEDVMAILEPEYRISTDVEDFVTNVE